MSADPWDADRHATSPYAALRSVPVDGRRADDSPPVPPGRSDADDERQHRAYARALGDRPSLAIRRHLMGAHAVDLVPPSEDEAGHLHGTLHASGLADHEHGGAG